MIDRLNQLANDKVEVLIAYNQFQKNLPWWCQLKKAAEGIKLEIEGRGSDYESAIASAIEKWDAATRGPIKELTGTLIEYRPPMERSPIDEETPF